MHTDPSRGFASCFVLWQHRRPLYQFISVRQSGHSLLSAWHPRHLHRLENSFGEGGPERHSAHRMSTSIRLFLSIERTTEQALELQAISLPLSARCPNQDPFCSLERLRTKSVLQASKEFYALILVISVSMFPEPLGPLA